MSEPTPAATNVPVLSPIERRVLGVLVEKAFTTPDAYPLTANATITACNQKSNRDPVSSHEPHEVDEALFQLKDKGLVLQVFPATGRTERWKQNLREAWGLDRPLLAVLAELFLRGPQTEGDLRARASRMAPLESLDDLRAILNTLSERGFVRRLSPEGRRRGVVWAHLLLTHREREELDRWVDDEGDESASHSIGASASSTREQLAELSARLDSLEARLAAIEKSISAAPEPPSGTGKVTDGKEEGLLEL